MILIVTLICFIIIFIIFIILFNRIRESKKYQLDLRIIDTNTKIIDSKIDELKKVIDELKKVSNIYTETILANINKLKPNDTKRGTTNSFRQGSKSSKGGPQKDKTSG